jgi:putative lipoic acid-binding regulatory protein
LSQPADHDAEEHRRAVELLEANHTFPCEFSLSVITRDDEAVTAGVLAAAGVGDGGGRYERRASAQGKYVSHRLKVPCSSAEDVLRLFARLRAVPGVITMM